MAPDPAFFEPGTGTEPSGPAESSDSTYSGDVDFERVKEWFRQDQRHSNEWRIEARMCFDFVSGQQWSEEDAAYLKESLRPIITFNRIAPLVDSVGGLEVNNRQEVRYFPRHVGDSAVDELMTDASKWIRDECEAEDEESDAFLDLVQTGMGWTLTSVKYDEDVDGKACIERVDPLEMYWDAASRKKNLGDARRIERLKRVPVSEAEDMFPDEEIEDIDASWAADTAYTANEPHNAEQAPFYRNDQSGKVDRNTQMILLLEVQWWEHETVYRMIDPFTGQEEFLTPAEYKTMNSRLDKLRTVGILNIPDPKVVKQRRRCFWKAFVGNKILKVMKGAEEGGFSYKAMTGKRDRNKGTFYGLVRAMIDPQKWANKWLSQTLHIMNTNATGGIIAKENAFANPQEAQDNWADPSAIVWATKQANLGTDILPKPKSDMPAGMQDLMEFAISSIRDVSGINLELLGMADRDQPGILEHQRKQAAMTVLAGLFDALRRYRKDQGRLLLFYITRYLSDGRLVRIGGQDMAKYVPLIRKADTVRYDVIVDDTPNSVNIKDKVWGTLMQMMPMLSKMPLPPQIWLSVLKYSPLPSSLVAEITQIISKPQQQKPDPKVQAAQIGLQAKQMDLQGKNIDFQIQQSEAQDAAADKQMDMLKFQSDEQLKQGDLTKQAADIEYVKSQTMLNYANAAKLENGITMDRVDTALNAVDQSHAMLNDQAAHKLKSAQTTADVIGKLAGAHAAMNPPKPQNTKE